MSQYLSVAFTSWNLIKPADLAIETSYIATKYPEGVIFYVTAGTYLSWERTHKGDRRESPWRNCTLGRRGALDTNMLAWRMGMLEAYEAPLGISLRSPSNMQLKKLQNISLAIGAYWVQFFRSDLRADS